MILKSIDTMIALKQIFKPGRIITALMFTFLSLPAWAQSNGAAVMSEEVVFYTMVGVVFAVAILVLLVAIYVLQLLKVFVAKDATEEELANHLPPWWKGIFYLTIVYGIIYILIFHVFKTAPLQEEKYEIAMVEAEEDAIARQSTQTDTFDETTVTFTDAPSDLGAGKKIFEMQCAPCHKADGGGSVGPNLTDDYWIHGGSMKDIYYIIKVGVPSKGMIAWEQLLSPERMRNVSSYIMTLVGTNPPGAKAAQGDLYEPEGAGQ